MKTGLLYGIVASSKTRVRCVFCGVHIPKASKCIEQHTNGAKHKENVELMAENGINFKEQILYCKPCNINLPIDVSVPDHVDGEDHGNWMAAMDDLTDGEFINLDAYLSSDSEELLCEVCNSAISCTLQNVEEHVNGFNHRRNVIESLKPQNGIFSVDNTEEVWCKICDAYIENTVQDILNHIDDDDQHTQWFSEVDDLIENQEVSIQNYLSNEHESKAFCSKCNIEIICNPQSIETHVNSDFHLAHFGV